MHTLSSTLFFLTPLLFRISLLEALLAEHGDNFCAALRSNEALRKT